MTRMDCGEVRELLPALEDDELPGSERVAILEHLKGCAGCTGTRNDFKALRRRIHASGNFVSPPGLEARVRDAVSAADQRRDINPWKRLGSLAASHVLVGLLAALATYMIATREQIQVAAVRDVVTAHVRSMLSEQAVHVASADTHTVKPWFAGKVPYAPDVTDLSALGFPLVGGRMDHVLDRPVAALVYSRRKHKISLFILPETQTAAAYELQSRRDGYNVVAWRRDGFAYFATSDLNASELRDFAQALGRRPPG